MDYAVVLLSFLVIGALISVAVSLINMLIKPFKDIKKYSLITGFLISTSIFVVYNVGIMETLKIPVEGISLQPYFHYVDIALTSVLGMGGAKGFREFIKKVKPTDGSATIVNNINN